MPSKNSPDVAKGELAGILRGYGINPKLFDDLIRQAVINQWSPSEFTAQLYASDEFAAAFPGIFGPDGSLKVTPAQYLQMAYGFNGYVEVGKNFGLSLGPRKIGMLFQGDVSPTEWSFRAMALADAKSNEIHRQSYNAVITAMGHEPLSKDEWFRHFAGMTDAKVENVFEAAKLYMAPGLDVSAEEAVAAARSIGAQNPRAVVDIGKVIAATLANKDIVGPELQAAGITDADLAVLNAGQDPKGIGPMLEQIVKNRNLLTSSQLGSSRGTFPAQREGL